MRDALKIGLGIVIGVLALSGLCAVCALIAAFGLFAGLVGSLGTPAPAGIVPPAFGTPPAPAETMSSMGTGVRVDDLRITPLEYRFGEAYRDRWGSREEPPRGAKFLWVRITVENVGENAVEAPSPADFLIRHKGKDIRADFFREHPNIARYEGGTIYPGVQVEGWLRLAVPVGAEARDLLLVLRKLFTDQAVWRLGP